MKLKMFCKTLALTLTVIFTVNCVPANAIEYIVQNLKSESEQSDVLSDMDISDITDDAEYSGQTESEVQIKYEVTDMRSAYTKVYRMSDSTYRLVKYTVPVHYQTESEWKEIDNSLVAEEPGENGSSESSVSQSYITKSTPYSITLLAKANGKKLVTYDTGEVSVSLTPAEIKRGKAKALNSNIAKSTVKIRDNYAFYSDVYENADLEYTVESYKIKENIIVKSASDSYEYCFILNTDKKDTEAILENGQIYIYKISDGERESEPAMVIDAPVMTDAAGKTSRGIELSLEKQKKGEYIITVIADREWMNADERVFPVRIDPTITEYFFTPDDYVISWDGSYAYSNIRIGENNSAYFRYNLPELPANAKIIRAKLNIEISPDYDYGSETSVYVSAISAPWTKEQVANGTLPAVSNASDSRTFADDTEEPTDSYLSLNITDVISAWYDGTKTNYGLNLLSVTKPGVTAEETCIIRANEDNINIQINFAIPDGLSNKWSTHSVSAGERSGTAYIKDLTGSMTYVHNDMSTNGALLPVTVQHIYNNTGNGIYDSIYGKGWSLNVLQTMKKVIIDMEDSPDVFVFYEHTDATGGKTYFEKDALGIYRCESNPTVTYDESTRKINYMDGSFLRFNTSGYLIEYYKDYYNDGNGISQTITYASGVLGKVLKVTDGAGNVIGFTYNSTGLLSQIYYGTPGTRALNFTYNASDKSINKISYADGDATSFTYSNTGDEMFSISCHSGGAYNMAYFFYDNNARVTSSAVYHLHPVGLYSVYDYIYNFTYGDTTLVKLSTNGVVYSERIYFDSAGRTVGIIDSDGYFSYGEYAGEELTAFNVVERHTSGKVSINNLIEDGNIQSSTLIDWKPTTSVSTDSLTAVTAYGYAVGENKSELGAYGLSVEKLYKGLYNSLAYNKISVTPGKSYTISAVVAKSTLLKDTAGGAVVGFAYKDSTDNQIKYVYSTGNSSGVYEQISYTFTFPDNVDTDNVWAIVGIEALKNENLKGKVVFDLIQVETGAAMSGYNYLRNSCFENGTYGWTVSGGSVVTDEVQGKAVRLSGSMTAERYVSQTVKMNLKAGNLLAVGCWAKAQSSTYGFYGIKIYFRNAARGENASEEVSLDKYITDWQYMKEIVVVPIDCDSIEVKFMYNENINSAYFTGLTLETVSVFDEAVNGSFHTYDAYGRLEKSVSYNGDSVVYTYNSNNGYIETEEYEYVTGDTVSVTYTYVDNDTNLLDSKETTYIYAGEDERIIINTENYTYDNYGNVLKEQLLIEDPYAAGVKRAQAVYYEYTYSDNHSLCLNRKDAEGRTTYYTYNQFGEVISVRTPDSVTAEYTYDSSGHVTKATERNDGSTNKKDVTYSYAGGAVTGIAHNGFNYSFGYNNFGKVKSVGIVKGAESISLAAYEYDGTFGQISKVTYGNGEYSNYVYDKRGNLLYLTRNKTTVSENNAEYIWSYDDRGAVVSVLDKSNAGSSVKTEYSYDSEGRIKSIKDSQGNSFLQRYYSKENKSEYSYLSGGKGSFTRFMYESINSDLQSVSAVNADFEDVAVVTKQADQYGRITENITSNPDTANKFAIGYSYRWFEDYYLTSSLVRHETKDVTGITYDKVNASGTYTKLLPTLGYEYDSIGNIKKIYENGVLKVQYYYDTFGQLIRENNKYLNNGNGYTVTYTYDAGGNMTKKEVYSYTTGSVSNLTPIDTVVYGYDGTWKDMMVSADGASIERDSLGNPLSYPGKASSMTWSQGNKLVYMSGVIDTSAANMQFVYNQDGLRTLKKKHIGGHYFNTNYIWIDGKLQAEYTPVDEIVYCYDSEGTLIGFTYESDSVRTFYRYVLNLQGDVIAILDESYNVVVRYTYDTWGKVLSVTGSLASSIGKLNPIRYRGYYYDVETGLYYLQSRYYDPDVGRFISADNQISGVGGGILGYNMFAYCFNNPVNMSDSSGHWPQWIKNAVKTVASVVTQVKAVLNIPSTVAKIAVASTIAVISGQATVEDVVKDAKNYSFFNTDETKVLNSKVFSSYKGTPVLKHDVAGITSFSVLNTIILNKSETVSNGGVDTVKHEWGHTVQQSLIGTPKFMTRIAVPSMISCITNPSSKIYYSLPWERSADFFGGANRSTGYYAGSSVMAGLYLIIL